MIDLTAPIVPGKSAGSINLGTAIDDVLGQTTEVFEITTRPYTSTVTIYTSTNIAFHVIDGKIRAIVARGAYQGKVHGKIGLGNTLKDVERELGKILEEDAFLVEGLLGISFEPPNGPDISLPIDEIYVYEDDGSDRWGAIPVELT